MFAVGELKHKIMQSLSDEVILLTQRELSGTSLICVKSVKIVDKDFGLKRLFSLVLTAL